LKVREREPQTLDDAIMIAQRLEVFKSAIKHRRIFAIVSIVN